MATEYPPPAETDPWTFHEVVSAVNYTSHLMRRPMPAWIRDNRPGSNLLVLDFASIEKMHAWYEYFGVRQHRADPPVWAWGWHGWTVMLSVLPHKDSGSGDAIETPSSEPVDTADDRPAALVPCERRIVGDPHDSHTHEHSSGETVLCIGYESRQQAVAAAFLTPDAPILSGSAMCRVPHIRTGDGPSIVARCTLRAGHDGDHVDTLNGQWANDYTAAVAL